MDYFIITQDKRYLRTPVIQDLYHIAWRKDLTTAKSAKIPDVNTVFANSENSQDFIDILDGQLFLVSSVVKHIFLMYEPSVRFKMFCILNAARGDVGEYYAPIIKDVACISPKSEFNWNKSDVKKLILYRKKVADHAIFRVSGIQKEIVVVRLDVAESLLRRKLRGIQLKRLEME